MLELYFLLKCHVDVKSVVQHLSVHRGWVLCTRDILDVEDVLRFGACQANFARSPLQLLVLQRKSAVALHALQRVLCLRLPRPLYRWVS